jgi:hypothetical protein
MKAILYGLVGATLAAGAACAQTTTSTPRAGTAQVPPPAPAQVVPHSGANTANNAYSGTATVHPNDTTNTTTNNGKAAASGDTNQAVATTSQSADMPARGANSFTEGEARNRIESKGYSNISGLSKNNDGIWEGKADKAGHQVTVWLDYKGNVGEHAL